jgi:hypothetical protein
MSGYFVDGMIYASLARNLAEGYGSFWDMRLSGELFRHFHEHPPLGIYIQSLFFKVMGDTELIDKYYGFVVGFGILALIAKIRKQLYGDINGSWFVLLAFILFPITGYVLSYNWLEHIFTLNILLTASVCIYALQSEKQVVAVLSGLLSGFFIFTGFMIKGPAALYPLAIPFFAWIFLPNVGIRRAATILGVMIISCLLSFWILTASNEQAAAYLSSYINDQVIGSLSGDRSVHSRTKLLDSLLTEELVSPLLVFSLLMFLGKTAWKKVKPDNRFWFFLAIALSGSVPLMLSPKQNDYYLFIAMPFYALAIAALFEPLRSSLEEKVVSGRRIMIAAMIVLLLVPVVMLSKQGEYRKDKAFHKSFTDVRVDLPQRVYISACPKSDFFADWNIVANFQRYYSVTLTREPGRNYLVTTREDAEHCTESGEYRLLSSQEGPYLLYKRIDEKSGGRGSQ